MSNRRDSATLRLLVEALASDAIVRARDQFGPPGYSSHFYSNHAGGGAFPHHHPPPEEHASSTFAGIIPTLRRIFLFLAVGVCLLISSLGLYGVFYAATMPELHASVSLYFDYTGMARHPAPSNVLPVPPPCMVGVDANCTNGSVTAATYECTNGTTASNGPSNITHEACDETPVVEPIAPPSTLPTATANEGDNVDGAVEGAPWAVADLFSQHSRWEAHHPDVLPPPITQAHILTPGTAHYMEVLLDLPESERNLQMGMFGVLVVLQSGNGTRLASSMRAARIPYESFWISVVRKVICIVPHMIGALPESRRVLVPSFRHYVESERLPLHYVTVRLIMLPEKAGRGEYLEVLKGFLHIGKELTNLQLLLKDWFFTSLTVGTMFFFGLQVFLIVAIRWYRQYRRDRIMEDDASDNLFFEGMDGVGSDGGGHHGLGGSNDANEGGPHDDGNHDHDEDNTADADDNFVEGFQYDPNDEGQDGEWEDLPPHPVNTQRHHHAASTDRRRRQQEASSGVSESGEMQSPTPSSADGDADVDGSVRHETSSTAPMTTNREQRQPQDSGADGMTSAARLALERNGRGGISSDDASTNTRSAPESHKHHTIPDD